MNSNDPVNREAVVTVRGLTSGLAQVVTARSRHFAGDENLDRIEWRMDLNGQLTVDQRERLLQIAQRCPMHRTLTSSIDIRPLPSTPD